MLTDRVTQRCIALPRHPLPSRAGRWVLESMRSRAFQGTLALEKRRTGCSAPWGWKVSLVLQGSNSSHMRCSPAGAEATAARCRSQQQPALLVGLEVGLALGCCHCCTWLLVAQNRPWWQADVLRAFCASL